MYDSPSAPAAMGLSPPTRGNRCAERAAALMGGSIPAHAGEPGAGYAPLLRAGVYPRPRGGTLVPIGRAPNIDGLSPPTRGNPQHPGRAPASSRSIPAHAGEPSLGAVAMRSVSVYPRPRGGTTPATAGAAGTDGLSPPTRGNRRWGCSISIKRRSIPAHAGEPKTLRQAREILEVYPRPRGGTVGVRLGEDGLQGLSPPTRGNRLAAVVVRVVGRSIPAHAGEPATKGARRTLHSVYPRPRGGTENAALTQPDAAGLSPPTRGNQDSRLGGAG